MIKEKMANNSILVCLCKCVAFVIMLQCLVLQCYSYNEMADQYKSFTFSNFVHPQTTLRMSEWSYIRVELPQWFSSMSVAIESDVDLDTKNIRRIPEGMLPVMCFRDGSLPLPDVSDISLEAPGSDVNVSTGRSLANLEHCYPMQKNVSLKLTNQQISPGVWYFGIFNGIGVTRTQSKMINRGPTYSFSANIKVEVCATPTVWGSYCNQIVESLSCLRRDSYNLTERFNGTVVNLVSCRTSARTSCHGYAEPKYYTLEVLGIAEQLTIRAKDLGFSVDDSADRRNDSVNLTCFARHGAMPSVQQHDYSASLDKASLIIPLPKVGHWYILILPSYHSASGGDLQGTKGKVCYSLELEVLECPVGKAGPSCSWDRYTLQTVLIMADSFQSYYLPLGEKATANAANFFLEPLLSKLSHGRESDNAWTYFLMDIPRGAAGENIHIRLTSDTKIDYEIYARFGGLPSRDSWDYYYANESKSSDGSVFFVLQESSERKFDFYILYVKEGTWSFGIRQLSSTESSPKDLTTISVSLERCPNECSSNGRCITDLDSSGLSSYSFCDCDRTHGGFDCSIEVVSTQGRRLQAIFLIASNAAAVLPAYWSLRKKAYAEWVLFTSSGIASGIYHACDIDIWCILPYNVLHFMDFWLSFMAVVSTFFYLTTISEVSKRAIDTAVAIITAIMALPKANRSFNIIFVVAIGALGLLIGWVMVFYTKWRQYSYSLGRCLDMLKGWQPIKVLFCDLNKTLRKRFRWRIFLVGIISLALASTSWILETSENYWIWHSIWHATIYTSSFLFLYSKAEPIDREHVGYALTRQNSIPRMESYDVINYPCEEPPK